MRLKPEAWWAHVSKQKESGLSAAEYCRRAGLPLSTFRLWAARKSNEGGKFVPVESGERPGAIEVTVGRATIRVTRDSDVEVVKRLIEALSC